MVRIIESVDHEFVNLLTLYQNSSNPVRNRDLRSNDPVQIRLKHEFRRRGYYYEIKRGEEYEKMAKKYPALKAEFEGNVINNEILAKLLATVKASPSVALSGGSDKFFGDYYDRLFTSSLSSFDCLAIIYLYDVVRETYSGKTKTYYAFEKDWKFKNRALFYVVHWLHKSLGKDAIREKNFVSFCENNTAAEYGKFVGRLEKIINKYFFYIYKTWNEIEYYNRYLQNPNTLSKIFKRYMTEIDSLQKKTEDVFKNIA